MKTPFLRVLPLLLAAVPVVVFYGYFGWYAVNVPFQDDYDGVLGSVMQLLDARSAGEWFQALIAQDDEYRVSFVRLVSLGLYGLTGEVDFRVLGWLGNLLLLGFLVLFFRTTRQLGLPVAYFAPVPFLLLTQHFYEGTFWGWIPCQYFAVLFWAFLTLYLVSRNRIWSFVWAVGLAVVTTFTNGNGLLVFGAGAVLLLYIRRWNWLVVWLLTMAAAAGLYFYGWELPAYRPKLADNLRAWPVMVSGLFAFLGAHLDILPDQPTIRRVALPVAAGLFVAGWVAALLVVFLRGTWVRLQKDTVSPSANQQPTTAGNLITLLAIRPQAYLFVLGGLLFVGLTAGILVVGRASLGLDTVLLSRYKLNAALIACLTYLSVAAVLAGAARRTWALAFGAVAVGVWGWTYARYTPDVAAFRKEKLLDTFAWRNTRTLPTSPIYLTPVIHRSLDSLFIAAQRRKLYQFPTPFFSEIENDLLAPLPAYPPIAPLPDTLRLVGEFLVAENETFAAGPRRDDGAYLLLKSSQEMHLFSTYPHRSGRRRLLTSGRLYRPGFTSFRVLKASLSPGTYRVGWLVVDGDRKRFGYTPQTIRVEKSLKTALTLAD
jgi:hypothetical protein